MPLASSERRTGSRIFGNTIRYASLVDTWARSQATEWSTRHRDKHRCTSGVRGRQRRWAREGVLVADREGVDGHASEAL